MSEINLILNSPNSKGNLKYEYNPFYNYLITHDVYKVNGFLITKDLAVDIRNGRILSKKSDEEWVDSLGNVVTNNDDIKLATEKDLYAKAGSLIEFDTDKLNFDLQHPVDITILPSYDGSVNLILNDGKNNPRLINSRFSVRERNTYEIVDRIGENDTNVYNEENFEKDTSLYFLYETNPKIIYNGLIGGTLPVGLYCFYLTYCDSDNNESDIIAETGLIPVFIGSDGNTVSLDGGIKNQSSNKGIELVLKNLDKSYNYVKVYYIRYFADYLQNRVVECKKLYLKFPISRSSVILQITGTEETEDIDPQLINSVKFNAKSVLAQALCKNMLFFGNIVKNMDNYKELLDCALRILPNLVIKDVYTPSLYYSGESGYYNSKNMYNNVGYFNKEYYRFGVVFIYKNGTLSNVYNTSGLILRDDKRLKYKNSLYSEDSRNYISFDDFGWINNKELYIDLTSERINAKGVCKIDYNFVNIKSSDYYNKTIGIEFNIPDEVRKFLENKLGIRGLFFVRLKCVPTILAQCCILPFDSVLQAPILPNNKVETFVSLENRELVNNYSARLFDYGEDSSSLNDKAYAAICPDFLLNQPYFNLIFNGGNFLLQKIVGTKTSIFERLYLLDANNLFNNLDFIKTTICTVTEDVPTVSIKDKIYRLNIGKAEEAYRFRFAKQDTGQFNQGESPESEVYEKTNIVRGIYSPYLAIYCDSSLDVGGIYNIYLENRLSEDLEFLIRMNSSEPFYSISDRYNFSDLSISGVNTSTKLSLICFRGDCYSNVFTYRLNRNFNDSSLPNNDCIIDPETWKNHYKENKEDRKNISRSDVNAITMGSWISFKLHSSINYALRSVDHSYVSEEALMGSARTFYPKCTAMYLGEYKIPDSYLYNDAYRASLGFKSYYTLLDINYLKNTFSNRILYSSIAIQDSYKNNYRDSLSTYYRDYSSEYGGITKLIGFEGHLLVVLEHAIGIAVINERILTGNGDGEPVFINTKNVLPEELTIITDTYGSLWPESVIKSEAGYVYGIDTVAKKIWRIQGLNIEILSDFKVNSFLVNNISLSESELYPIVGLKNVKTHYNNNKKDIIFTFYDDVYKDEEKVWSLCYNELLGLFITFYSWVPSYSENIDTLFFTFDRNTSKNIALLYNSNYYIKENTGVLLENIVFTNNNNSSKLHYRNSLNEEEDESVSVSFKLEKDHWKYSEYFEIDENNNLCLKDIDNKKLLELLNKVIILYITPIETTENETIKLPTESIAITFENKINNLTTDFYLHGKSGIIDIKENVYPTYWYGEYHPFEFEFIVNDKIGQQKIFENLVIISNKAEPESFHFEIEGDNYEFSSDKRTMYFRLEATKNLYLNLGSDILYDRKFTDVIADKYTYEEYYRTLENAKLVNNDSKLVNNDSKYINTDYDYSKIDKVYPKYSHGLVLQVKSTIFPLYYERVDTYNEIYDLYTQMTGSEYDFKNLSGSEIKWNRDLNLFNIVTHIKNNPIDLVGRLRGNSRYKEGKWSILIPSIIFNLKNENNEWIDIPEDLEDGPLKDKSIKIPPIVVNSSNLPKSLPDKDVSQSKLPSIYLNNKYNWPRSISNKDWTYRKEARIRDKWIKIRVRYSGRNLAVIHSLITLYNISYG